MRTSLAVSVCCLLGALHVDAYAGLDLGALLPSKGKGAAASAPTFNAAKQLVSTTGIHAFQPPGPSDLRGPCPGLNAAANHGYLPRSGLSTIVSFTTGLRQAFGMATDLATILAAYGAVLDGQAVSWSIGGGPHIGIGGSHNNYETDSSPLRGDLYQYGSSSDLVMSQFLDLYNMQPDAATANYDIDIMKQFRAKRFNESISKNPAFYYAPFSGVVVSQAAFIFIARLFSNKSEEYPEGYLNKDVLKSFMGISGPENNLTWTYGHERIPDNWYRTSNADAYSLASLRTDTVYMATDQTYILQPGCNTGKVNTFTAISTTYASSGAYTPAMVREDPLCFGLAYATAMALNTPLLGPVAKVVQELILPIQNGLGCITVPSLNETVGKACPGYSLFGGPTATIAPGAIQS